MTTIEQALATTHVGMGTTNSKKPWDGTPGVRKQKTPRVFTYNEKLTDTIPLMKVTLKMASYGAAELRRQEERTRSFYKAVALRQARIHEMRPRSRAAYLAYAFLRGRKYRNCESNTTSFRTEGEFYDLCYMVAADVDTYGGEKFMDVDENSIMQWIREGFDGTPLGSWDSGN